MPSTSMTSKAEEIRRVLSEPTVDLWKLRDLALTDGGLVSDSLRKLVWPKLVGVHNNVNTHSTRTLLAAGRSDGDVAGDDSVIPASLDREQIERDVSRVTWHLLTGNQRSRNFQMKNKHRKRIAQLLRRKQRRLGDFLNLILVWSYREEGEADCSGEDVEGEGERSDDRDDRDGFGGGSPAGGRSFITTGTGREEAKDESRLRYYQGFHDVASIVLSALGGASPSVPPNPNAGEAVAPADDLASSMGLSSACRVLLRLSRTHHRDALRSDFQRLQSALKLTIMPLAAAFDAELHSHLHDCDMEPFFCLSWVITWFAHDVRDTALVKRLYDFFIVSHPLMSVYMSVAMMIHPLNRIEVLCADCDFACVHHALADLPKNSSNVGWKYLPGEHSAGYVNDVTGEDEDDDANSYDPSLQDQSTDEDDGSLVSSSLGGRTSSVARVPFQELIDLAVSLMHKIPPRNLINLARRYHTEITLRPLMSQASTIALLQPPPAWSLAARAESDWVLRQKMREEHGLTKLNRHQRKKRLEQQGVSPVAATDRRKRPPSPRAVVASGTGPDGQEEARVLRRKRLVLMRSVAVVVLATLAASAKNYFTKQPSAEGLASSSRPRLQQQLTKDAPSKDSAAQLLLTDDGVDAVTDGAHWKGRHDKSLTVNDVIDVVVREEREEAQVQRMDRDENSLAVTDSGEKEKISPPEKKQNKVCEDDEDFPLKDVESSSPPSLLKKIVKRKMKSSIKQATPQVLLRSSIQLDKNSPSRIENPFLDIHLDPLEQRIDLLMMQLTHTAKAGCSKVATVLIKALQVGWHRMITKKGWLNRIAAPAVEENLSSKLEGGAWERAQNSPWKKREASSRNRGGSIGRVAKAGKENLPKRIKREK